MITYDRMPTPREWDGPTYDRISAPMEAMGRAVLDRLPLRGDETVLDAGCGSGRVTALLADRLPRGRVIGVDGSAGMIEAARQRLGNRATLFVSDLLELVLDDPVDAVLSTATFHWIADHDGLFARLHAALKPSGRLVAQCGGAGNIAALREPVAAVTHDAPYAEHLVGFDPWHFAGPEETAERLRRAGFTDIRTWLEDWDVHPDAPADWLRTCILGSHLDRLPPELHDPLIASVEQRVESPLRVGYVRLNIDARATA